MKYLIAIVAIAMSITTSFAASSDWQDIGGGKARMLAILSPQTGLVTGGVEIRLNKGWKTYWRSPGDSGIPPQFDFSKSVDFTSGEIFLPAPTHIIGKDASYVGYKEDVTFVFEGQPNGTNGMINLNLFLGVCEEVCIPAQANFKVEISDLLQSDPQVQTKLADAQTKLPSPSSDEFNIRSVEVGNRALNITIKLPGETNKAKLFAEGPSDWYMEPAKLVKQTDGLAIFHLDLSNVPKNAEIEATQLRYTVIAGDKSIEEWRAVK